MRFGECAKGLEVGTNKWVSMPSLLCMMPLVRTGGRRVGIGVLHRAYGRMRMYMFVAEAGEGTENDAS